MNIHNPITQNIISSRGFLLKKRSGDSLILCLEETLTAINTITVSSSAKIIDFCIKKTIERVKENDLFNGGVILNFIHNLPLDLEDEKKWNFNYFLSVELPTFSRRVDSIPDGKEIVLFVCTQLYERYFQNKCAN